MTEHPLLAGLLAAFLAVWIFEALAALTTRRGNESPPEDPKRLAGWRLRRGWMFQPTFAYGAGAALVALQQVQMPAENPGPALPLLGAIAAVLAVFVQWSGASGPKSERHFVALMAAGVAAVPLGASIPFTDFALGGAPVPLAPAASVIFTLLWLFLVASVIELGSLIPLLAPLIGGGLAVLSWRFGGGPQTFASYALAGVVLGGLAGHASASLLLRGGRFLSKADVLVLGWLSGTLTVLTFLKGMALVAVVLPLGFAGVVLVLLGIRSLERSLVLRPRPRD